MPDDVVDAACPYCVHCGLGSRRGRASGCAAFLLDEGGAASHDGASSEGEGGTADRPVRRVGLIPSKVATQFKQAIMANKRAVLIGVNRYRLPGADLRGCVNDVKNLQAILSRRYGFAKSDIVT